MPSVEFADDEVLDAVINELSKADEGQDLLREAMSNGLLSADANSKTLAEIQKFVLEELSVSVPTVPQRNGLVELVRVLQTAKQSQRLLQKLYYEVQRLHWEDTAAEQRMKEWRSSGYPGSAPRYPFERRLSQYVYPNRD